MNYVCERELNNGVNVTFQLLILYVLEFYLFNKYI